uniref:HDC12508 n=1 Tax=Drosophila melanogaster TaxID=7227 RepID=Q6IKG3_DROME|nr:TPA_inf: HDC12508 [Drosophila melanogaster]
MPTTTHSCTGPTSIVLALTVKAVRLRFFPVHSFRNTACESLSPLHDILMDVRSASSCSCGHPPSSFAAISTEHPPPHTPRKPQPTGPDELHTPADRKNKTNSALIAKRVTWPRPSSPTSHSITVL